MFERREEWSNKNLSLIKSVHFCFLRIESSRKKSAK